MMRKRIINRSSKEPSSADQDWLDLERLAQVEITSEDAGHPVESALTADDGPGWLAGEPGEQTIRLLFDEPQALRQIQLVFEEAETGAYPGVCAALVGGRRPVVPGDSAPAVHVQPARRDPARSKTTSSTSRG